MKLYLIGHDYKYAAEQMMLSLYPAERPEYPEGKPEGDRVELSLRKGKKFITCVCRIAKDGKMFVGRSAFNAELAADDLSRDRLCSRIIKNAFYRAALRSGHSRPAWGSLTGVRPGKLFCAMLDETGEPDTATRRFITEYDVSPERAKLCRDTSLVTRSVAGSLGDKDICLYVGIPFCPTRCSYCSFVSQSVQKSMKLIPPFLDALMLEIDAAAKAVNELGLHIISIYMGGGTPTTISAEQLDSHDALGRAARQALLEDIRQL
ncbi:coproporphyrinogen dehydrogenase [Firmicutes bacterium CAG:555]|nr:coproporphyrinogen dehydrogenase [Firmicutes bacterium CAG:555]